MFGPVSILGDAVPGEALIARTGGVVRHTDLIDGTEQFQWLRDGAAIKDETLQSYMVKPSDIGHEIAVRYRFETLDGPQAVTSKAKSVDLGYWRNLYWEFEGREPDAEGLAFWDSVVRQLFGEASRRNRAAK